MAGCSSQNAPASTQPDKVVVSGAPVEASSKGPDGTELIDKIDLPLYPGAKITGSTIQTGPQIPQDEHRYHVQFETADPVEKVVAFYKTKGEMLDSMEGGKGQVMGTTPKGNRTIIVVEAKDGKTQVSISSIAYEATH